MQREKPWILSDRQGHNYLSAVSSCVDSSQEAVTCLFLWIVDDNYGAGGVQVYLIVRINRTSIGIKAYSGSVADFAFHPIIAIGMRIGSLQGRGSKELDGKGSLSACPFDFLPPVQAAFRGIIVDKASRN
jgi:hypothetical protein